MIGKGGMCMMYDLLQTAWFVMAVITEHIGRKKEIDFYKNVAFWGCIIMSEIVCVVGKIQRLL